MAGPKSLYLLSGDSHHHRKTRDPLIREMLRETGRDHPTVAYIGTASGDDAAFWERKACSTWLVILRTAIWRNKPTTFRRCKEPKRDRPPRCGSAA